MVASFGCDDAEALCDFYLRFLNELADSGEEVFAHDFYQQVRKEFPALPADWKDERLYRQLRDVGIAFKVYPNKWMNGNLKQIRLGVDNGVWQKWVDAGLDGKTKSTGEVFAEGDRVKVFSVTRLSNPSAGTFTPEFGDTSSTDQGDASLVAEEVA